jgi:hypothetical protein
MKRLMMRKAALLGAVLAFVPTTACYYGAMVVHPNGKIYVQVQDPFMFGALRKLYECTPDGVGNVTCIRMSGRP